MEPLKGLPKGTHRVSGLGQVHVDLVADAPPSAFWWLYDAGP